MSGFVTAKRVFQNGDYYIWLSGAAIALSLTMVGGLLLLILFNGLSGFWLSDLQSFTLRDGRTIMGEEMAREPITAGTDVVTGEVPFRLQVKQGNRDLYGQDFVWIDEAAIEKVSLPAEAVLIERREWGHFYGFLQVLGKGDQVLAKDSTAAWSMLDLELSKALAIHDEAQTLLRDRIGAINYHQEQLRLEQRSLEQEGKFDAAKRQSFEAELAKLSEQNREFENRLSEIRSQDTAYVQVVSIDGQTKKIPLSEMIAVFRPNEMGLVQKLGVYFHRLWNFVWDDPRESNTEGGVFPAIFGTVMLVMIMSVIVTPFGILAAIYLREYARQGKFVSIIRIAVNNLAGVPSIVFGVFGVGFFVYFLGGNIDRMFFAEALPTPTYGTGGILWASLTLALLTVPTVIVATEEGLAAMPKHLREASYALGATKFETLWRVVLPALTPAILTGVILAVARAAGEVAPLMITGVVKLAPSLPVDGYWPFVHLDRKFMHLGFHIFDVGFQSPNVEAARPMVYSSTLLLLLVVILLNLSALIMRNRLRKRYRSSAV